MIGFDDQPITASNTPVKGVARQSGETGMDIAVTCIGMDTVRAVGAIQAGDRLTSANPGGAAQAAADAINVFATALSNAGDGEWLHVLIR